MAVSDVLLVLEGLGAVLSSDLGCWPLGRLFLQQGQRVSLLNGAQLLLLCPLELGRVSDLGGRRGVISGARASVPVPVGKGSHPAGVWGRSRSRHRQGTSKALPGHVCICHVGWGHSPLGQPQPSARSPGVASGSQPGAVSSPGTHKDTQGKGTEAGS